MKIKSKEVFKLSNKRYEKVSLLQDRLRMLGFDPGESDGYYGYLTREAVKEFQAAYGLKVDGIAGTQVLSLLSEKPIGCRMSVMGEKGMSIKSIAVENSTTVDAILAANRDKNYEPVFTGNRLKVYKRMLIGVSQTNTYDVQADEAGGAQDDVSKWTMLAKTVFKISEDGDLKEIECDTAGNNTDLLAVVSDRVDGVPFSLPQPSGGSGKFLNGFAKRPDDNVKRILKKVKGMGAKGVLVDMVGVDERYGTRFTKFFRLIKQACAKENIMCGLTIDFPQRPAKFDCFAYDLPVLSKLSDFVMAEYRPATMLSSEIEDHCTDSEENKAKDRREPSRPFGSDNFRTWMSDICLQVPKWKLVVSVYMGCFRVKDDVMFYISEDEINSLRSKYILKEAKDKVSGYSFYRYKAKGKYHKVWREDKSSIGDKLYIINRYNALGIAFSGYEGMEKSILSEVEKKFIII